MVSAIFAVTTETLKYWLSFTQSIWDNLRQVLERACCESLLEKVRPNNLGFATLSSRMASPGANTASASETARLISVLQHTLQNPSHDVDPFKIVLDALGGKTNLTQIERENPIESILSHQLLLPLLQSLNQQPTPNTQPRPKATKKPKNR
jgi:hypothetical protein